MGTLAENFYPGTKDPLSSADVIKRVQQETDTIMCAFSYGKDSIATYLSVKDHFKTVIPFMRVGVPGLKFIERRIQYYEEKFGVHIYRYHEPHFYRMIKNCVWQPPHRVPVIEAMQLPDVSYEDLNALIRLDHKLPKHTMLAVGVRQADSLQRRVTCKTRGAINWNTRNFWPIWDKSHQETADMIRGAGIKLPIDYLIWGTSYDGLRYFFLKEIKKHYPEDYQTILEWYPFAELEFFRRQLAGGTYEAKE
jgi:hypothetical protein